MKHYQDLKCKKEDGILWVTLSRPDFANAFSEEMVKSLIQILLEADLDHQIRVVVLTGEGKNFCAGGDIDQMEHKKGMFAGDSNELRERYIGGIQRIPKVMHEISVPVIAMVNGAAIGAGLDLACMCDIRLASDKASFGETFAKLALVPGDGGTYFLPRIIGYARAMEMFLTGKIIGAVEAQNIGLISQHYSHDHLEAEVKKLATQIARNSPIALRMIKKAMIHSKESNLHSHLDLLAAYQGITQRTSDHFESISAFKTRRDPKFDHR